MTTLTIYTEKYDKNENVVREGMSGKAFLDMDSIIGIPFNSLDEAMEYCFINDINPARIEVDYVTKDGIQMFRKFNIDV